VAAAVHPHYTRATREFERAGRPVVGSGPVGVDGTAEWLRSVGETAGVPAERIGAAVDGAVAAVRGALAGHPVEGRITVSGYEGSELLVARVLVEAGAEVPYVGTALPKSEWSARDREWLEEHGAHVQYRATLEQDVAAYGDVNPDLVIGTTPVVQRAKEDGIPGLYFTNLISARPIFGPAGAGGLSQVLETAIDGRDRLNRMKSFFQGVGDGHHAAGYGHDGVPERRLTAKERNARARGGKAVTGSDAKEDDDAKGGENDGPSASAGADGDEDGKDARGRKRDTRAHTDTEARIRQSNAAKGTLDLSRVTVRAAGGKEDG
jgi:chlorophyllide a reductase subunit Y